MYPVEYYIKLFLPEPRTMRVLKEGEAPLGKGLPHRYKTYTTRTIRKIDKMIRSEGKVHLESIFE